MTATTNAGAYERHPDVFEELGVYAEFLHNLTRCRWDELSEVDPEERNLFLEGSPIRHKVISIGRLANKAMGFAGMQTVMQAAFLEAYSKDVPDWTVEGHERSRWAISELNYVWHGIGEWLN